MPEAGLYRRNFSTSRSASGNHSIDVPETPHETTEAEVESGYQEHAKRLTRFTITTFIITFGLLSAFYFTNLEKHEKMITMAAYTCVVFALFFQLVLLLLIGCVKRPDPNWFRYYEEQMYIFVYGSNLLLMLAAFFLLLLCTSRYAYLSVFLISVLPLITSLLYQGSTLKHTESIKKYRAHDNELNFFSELSAVVVMMLFTSLTILVSSSPSLPRQNHQIKITECFLYITIIMSLLLMLLTSVPPAVHNRSTRIRMVEAVKCLAYTTFCLLAFVGLAAAGEILQGFAVFSTSVHIIGVLYWFITEIIYEHSDQVDGGPEQIPKEFDSLSMALASGSFSVLMFVYSKNVDSTELHNRWAYFLLLAVCMLSLCSTFIICLSKTVISYSSQNTRAWEKAEVILSNITSPLLFVAGLSSFLLAIYTSYAL